MEDKTLCLLFSLTLSIGTLYCGEIILHSVDSGIVQKYDSVHFVEVFVSLGTLRYRKPYIGMWNYFENHRNGGISVNRQSSFYVGNAAGRIQTSVCLFSSIISS